VESDSSKQQAALLHILRGWHNAPARQPLDNLRRFLDYSAQARISHIQEWLRQNTARFSPENGDIRALTRTFEALRDRLLSNLQVCAASCSSCQLPCILTKSDGSHIHNCLTDHQCLDNCDYESEHYTREACGLPYVAFMQSSLRF
jgi:hypothetical protein